MTTQQQTSLTIREDIALASFTTLRVGGPAKYFAEVHNEDELLESVRFARERALPIFVLGGGSNLLVADSGFPGLVIHLCLGDEIAWTADRTHIEVSAGHDWDAFTRIVCEQGISGIECLAGIPGLVGASPIQNIGAYGQEVATTIAGLRALDLETLEFVELPAAACRFAYRTSIFNSTHRNRYLVTRVDFRFDPAATPNLTYADLASLRAQNPTALDVYHAVRAIRDRKGMLLPSLTQDPASPHVDTYSAGSFFKNPIVPAELYQTIAAQHASVPHWPAGDSHVKLAAAWLIEQSGFPKGFTLGPVGISTRHTLALVNRTGTATCADLLRLRDTIIVGVHARFNVTLEQEPVYLS